MGAITLHTVCALKFKVERRHNTNEGEEIQIKAKQRKKKERQEGTKGGKKGQIRFCVNGKVKKKNADRSVSQTFYLYPECSNHLFSFL